MSFFGAPESGFHHVDRIYDFLGTGSATPKSLDRSLRQRFLVILGGLSSTLVFGLNKDQVNDKIHVCFIDFRCVKRLGELHAGGEKKRGHGQTRRQTICLRKFTSIFWKKQRIFRNRNMSMISD